MYAAYLRDVDDKYAPPNEEMLQVQVVDSVAFLRLVKYEEDNKTQTYTAVSPSIAVDIGELQTALVGGIIADHNTTVRRLIEEARRPSSPTTPGSGA